MSNIYFTIKKTDVKLHLYGEENMKKCTTFEEEKGTRYIRGNVYFGIIVFSSLSRLQTVSQIPFNLF